MRCAEHPEADEDALLFRDYHTIWHLIEIMALQFRDAPRDGGHMAVYGQEKEGDNRSGIGELLLDWLNTSSPYPFDLDQFGRGVGGERGERRGGVIALAEEHPEYWSTLVMLVSRGRMEEASALLQRHSHYPVQSDLDDVFGGGDSLSSHPLFVVCQLMKQMLRFRKGFSSQAEWTRSFFSFTSSNLLSFVSYLFVYFFGPPLFEIYLASLQVAHKVQFISNTPINPKIPSPSRGDRPPLWGYGSSRWISLVLSLDCRCLSEQTLDGRDGSRGSG